METEPPTCERGVSAPGPPGQSLLRSFGLPSLYRSGSLSWQRSRPPAGGQPCLGKQAPRRAQGPPAKRGQPTEARRETPHHGPGTEPSGHPLRPARCPTPPSERCFPRDERVSALLSHSVTVYGRRNSGLGFLQVKNPNVSVAQEVVCERVFNSTFSRLNAASWARIASNVCTSGVLNTLGNNIKSNPLLFIMGFHIHHLLLNSQESCDLGTAEDNLCFIQEMEAEQS